VVTAVSGCAPVEDCGGLHGWEGVKKAFRKAPGSRFSRQRELVTWATEMSGHEDYNPLAESEPSITVMNYEGRWENHRNGYMRISGERVPEDDFEDEDDMGPY